MSMVCPECHGSYEQSLQCPSCGVRLRYNSAARKSGGATARPEGQWQNTPWGRIAIGVLLAVGLAHGLKMLCTAGLLAASEETSRTVWATIAGLVVLQALQALSLLVGGALTAAGQQRGVFLGTIVGVASGFLFMLVQQLNGEAVTDIVLYGQPVLCLVFGALGGLLGSAVWKPLPAVETSAPSSDKTPVPRIRPPSTPSAFSGPVSVVRVVCGIVVVVCGVFWPAVILNFVLDYSNGKLRLQSQLEAQMITWEIAGVFMLLGGALAGATTRNGLKQGLCVGLGAGVAIVGNYLGSPTAGLEQTILLVASVLSLTLAGGWFGGQLFPPVVARRRRFGPAL